MGFAGDHSREAARDGLGSISEVSLKEAREAAERWRATVRDNKDPIKERERLRRAAARNMHLLRDIALDAFESRKAELKGDGVNGRWFRPIELHVLPKLGNLPVAEIDQNDIRDALAPIWHCKVQSSSRRPFNLQWRHLSCALGLGTTRVFLTPIFGAAPTEVSDRFVAFMGEQSLIRGGPKKGKNLKNSRIGNSAFLCRLALGWSSSRSDR